MNSLLNPFIGIPLLIEYATAPTRLHRFSDERLQRYKDNAFKKVVKYAYEVPVYHNKYKKAGIKPYDIQGIKDIQKLPFVTKKDMIENFPDNITPLGYKKENAYVASTSGSSGKPVSVYLDFYTISRGTALFLRQAKTYNFNWLKDKHAIIGTYDEGRVDRVVEDAYISKTHFIRSSDKNLNLNAYAPIKEIVDKLNAFEPDLLISYPITLQHIAYFKKKGYCDKLNPKILQSGGYSLDEYTKRYIEDAFNTRVVNLYQTVEACTDIAFECFEGTWHINHDYHHLEAVDENMEIVANGERGHVVETRLFGRGTPFVRYTGMDDWITLVDDYDCSCGLHTPILKNGVEGRVSARILLPDGRVYPAASFAIISLVLKDLKTFKVTQFQIIQKKIDLIEVLLVIDNDLRDTGPSVDQIFKKIKDSYEKLVGPDVKIVVKEVKELKSTPGKPSPTVISHVKLEDGFKILED